MITRKFLECDVVDVCNLSCKSCGHASPYYNKNYYTFEEFERDVRELSKVFHCEYFVFMGGEPLVLGEKIRDYVRVLRKYGLCDKLKIHTNGILAPRYTEVLKLFDIVYVSLYKHQHVPTIEAWAERHKADFETLGIEFYLAYKTMFAEVFTTERLTEERAEESWVKCGAKTWCNQLYKGHFYLCGPIAKFHRVLTEKGITVEQRGCSLYQPDLEERLTSYLQTKEKLPMCYHCLGHLDWHMWKEEKVQ